MTNKNKSITQKHGENKYRIIVKGDPEEKTVVYNGMEMIFRTKSAMLELLNKMNYHEVEEYIWIGM